MVVNSECSRPGLTCLPDKWAKSVKSPVETAALAFCEGAAVGDEDSVPLELSTGAWMPCLHAGAPKTAAWHLAHVCRDECKELVRRRRRTCGGYRLI